MKANIYKITNDVNELVYVGSTKMKLNKRWNAHKFDVKKGCQKLISKSIREIGEEHFKIQLIEEVDVATRDALRLIEQEEINKIDKNKCLNSISAYVSPSGDRSEYYKKYEAEGRNKEHRKQWKKDNNQKRRQDPDYVKKQREYQKEYMRNYRLKNVVETERE